MESLPSLVQAQSTTISPVKLDGTKDGMMEIRSILRRLNQRDKNNKRKDTTTTTTTSSSSNNNDTTTTTMTTLPINGSSKFENNFSLTSSIPNLGLLPSSTTTTTTKLKSMDSNHVEMFQEYLPSVQAQTNPRMALLKSMLDNTLKALKISQAKLTEANQRVEDEKKENQKLQEEIRNLRAQINPPQLQLMQGVVTKLPAKRKRHVSPSSSRSTSPSTSSSLNHRSDSPPQLSPAFIPRQAAHVVSTSALVVGNNSRKRSRYDSPNTTNSGNSLFSELYHSEDSHNSRNSYNHDYDLEETRFPDNVTKSQDHSYSSSESTENLSRSSSFRSSDWGNSTTTTTVQPFPPRQYDKKINYSVYAHDKHLSSNSVHHHNSTQNLPALPSSSSADNSKTDTTNMKRELACVPSKVPPTRNYLGRRKEDGQHSQQQQAGTSSSSVDTTTLATTAPKKYGRFKIQHPKMEFQDIFLIQKCDVENCMTARVPYHFYESEASLERTACFEQENDYQIHKSDNSKCVEIPRWRQRIIEGKRIETEENLDDQVFLKRHNKWEIDERRRKRWDSQRLREESYLERLKRKREERELQKKKKQRRGRGAQQNYKENEEETTFQPSVQDASYVRVEEDIPISVFGYPLPIIDEGEFKLPWDMERKPSPRPPPHSTQSSSRGPGRPRLEQPAGPSRQPYSHPGRPRLVQSGPPRHPYPGRPRLIQSAGPRPVYSHPGRPRLDLTSAPRQPYQPRQNRRVTTPAVATTTHERRFRKL